MTSAAFEILLVTAPGLELALQDEAVEQGFKVTSTFPGGVTIAGLWPEVWRANLVLRGVTRVLARVGSFRVSHLAQLDKRAHKFPWQDFIHRDIPVSVEVTCKRSRIYHAGAAQQRIESAISETIGTAISDEAAIAIKARIDDDLCTISIDTSGESLHKRGHKEAMAKAPMRETLAALFLRQCGYRGDMPVLDPMCGSGTFVIEAAEMARNLLPGRDRSFAFEYLPTFDAENWAAMKVAETHNVQTALRFHGSDRDAGAVRAAEDNAKRAGVDDIALFQKASISALERPEGAPGLVMINPPYGTRIGDKKPLFNLHASLGQTLRSKFQGWRVGLVTADKQLAYATGLPFKPPGPAVNHGGIRVFLFQTDALA